MTVAMLLFFSGCMTPYERGVDALNHQQVDEAEALAARGLAENPGDPELNLLMAQVLGAQNRYEEAETYARRALQHPRMRGEAGRELGRIQWELGRPIDAAKTWLVAQKDEPGVIKDADFIKILDSAITDALDVEEYEQALEFQLALRDIDPEAAQAEPESIHQTREKTAAQLADRGQLERSVTLYRELYEDEPREAYLLAIAENLATLDRLDEALETFDDYIQASESSARVQRMIQIAERAKHPEIAQHFFAEALDGLPEPTPGRAQVHFNRARLFYEFSEREEARAALAGFIDDQRALKGTPLDGDLWVDAANLAANHRDQPHAIELLEEGLEETGSHWGLASTLAGLYARRAQNPDVERVLNTFVERADSAYQARLTVGRWAGSRRNYDLARHYFERAVEENPEADGGTWLELADIYTELGHSDRLKVALTAYLKAVEPTSDNLGRAAAIYQGVRQYDEAEKLLKQVLQEHPEDLRALDELTNLYVEWDRFEQIVPYYDRWIAARGHEAADYRVIGQRLASRDEPELALSYIQQAAERGDHEAWLHIASIFEKQRRTADMRRALERFIDAADDRLSALKNARGYFHTPGMEEEELEILREIAAMDPESFPTYQRLSELLFNMQRPREAAEAWVEYVENAQDADDALRQIARRYDVSSRAEQGLVVYQELLKSDLATPELYRWLGDAYLSLSRLSAHRDGDKPGANIERATRYYLRYLEEGDPSQTELVDFAHALENQQMWEVAAQVYERTLEERAADDPLIFNYAQALLKTGRAERARGLFKEFNEARGANEQDARRIGEALFEAELYEAAGPYFTRLLDSDDPLQMGRAFSRLADIYRMTLRAEEIPKIAAHYLEHSQDPTQARQAVLGTLRTAGLHEEAARLIERLRQTQGNIMGFGLAESYYHAGDFDAAHSAFKAYADSNQRPGDAWVAVAEFYTKHGDQARASDAYQRAVERSPDHAGPHLEHAIFLILQGDLPGAEEALERARNKAKAEQLEGLELSAAQAMAEIGHFKQAAELAERALRAGNIDDEAPLQALSFPYRFATQSGLQARRTLEDLRRSSLRFSDKLDALLRAGFEDEIAAWLEDELVQGDHSSAMEFLENRAYLMTQKDGLSRLELAVKPLLDRSEDGSITSGQLGHILLRQGQLHRSIPYLQAAADHNFLGVLPLLASVYQSSGLDAKAMETQQDYLLQISSDERQKSLENLDKQQALFGRQGALLEVLEGLKSDSNLRIYTLPMMTGLRLESGQVSAAFEAVQDILSSILEAPELSEPSALALSAELDESLDILINQLKLLAAEGYLVEAAAILDELDQNTSAALRQDRRVQMLELNLAALSSPEESAQAVEALLETLDDSADDARIRLEAAEILQITGHPELAQEVARQNLQNFAPNIQKSTIEFLLANALARGDEETIPALSEELVEQSSAPLRAAEFVESRLAELAQDKEALKWARFLAEQQPTSRRARTFYERALAAGDKEAQESAAELLFRLDEDALVALNLHTAFWSGANELAAPRAHLELLRAAAPASFELRGKALLEKFRAGALSQARSELKEWLEFLEFEPFATEQVLNLLGSNGLFVESARVAAPLLEEAQLTARAHRELGRAFQHLAMQQEAREHQERFVEMSPAESIALTTLAEDMMRDDFHEEALYWAERAIEAEPERTRAYFWRGAARFYSDEDLEGAREDLARSLGRGIDLPLGLYRAAYHALRAGKDAQAERLVTELIELPALRQPGLGLMLAMGVFEAADRGEKGVDFLQANYPQLINGVGRLGLELVPVAANLYEAAGAGERAHQLYASAVERLLLLQPTSDRPRVYMNNLAYGLSNAPAAEEADYARAFSLVRRAIAATPERTPSYIDTLGWLYFRSGDLDKAERFIRSALGSMPADSSQIGELLEHLADLEDARGYSERASWLRVYRDIIEQN